MKDVSMMHSKGEEILLYIYVIRTGLNIHADCRFLKAVESKRLFVQSSFLQKKYAGLTINRWSWNICILKTQLFRSIFVDDVKVDNRKIWR